MTKSSRVIMENLKLVTRTISDLLILFYMTCLGAGMQTEYDGHELANFNPGNNCKLRIDFSPAKICCACKSEVIKFSVVF